MTNLDSILKSRDVTLSTKVHLVKSMVFPVVMYGWELDYKESWVPKNWCFWAVVLEKTLESHSIMSDSLWPHGLYSPRDSPGQNTGVGSLFLLQGIFPTQESNRGLLHCRRILYQLSYQGSPQKTYASPNPRVHPNPCTSSRWYHPTISSSVITFSSCLQSFPASGSFLMSQFI